MPCQCNGGAVEGERPGGRRAWGDEARVHHDGMQPRAGRKGVVCVAKRAGPAAAAQLLCDNRGPIQASHISLCSGMGPVQRSTRRVLRPVMLAEDGRGLQDDVPQLTAFALLLVLRLFPDAHLERHAFNIMLWSVQLRDAPPEPLWTRFLLSGFFLEIGLLLLRLALEITA